MSKKIKNFILFTQTFFWILSLLHYGLDIYAKQEVLKKWLNRCKGAFAAYPRYAAVFHSPLYTYFFLRFSPDTAKGKKQLKELPFPSPNNILTQKNAG